MGLETNFDNQTFKRLDALRKNDSDSPRLCFKLQFLETCILKQFLIMI